MNLKFNRHNILWSNIKYFGVILAKKLTRDPSTFSKIPQGYQCLKILYPLVIAELY